MMNQTEILKVHNGAQNRSYENIQDSSLTCQSSKITVIKANTYQSNRDKADKTPKVQIISKNNSSAKLIRVSSSKGINVLSVRPSSSEKQVKQFNTSNTLSINGGSETTIKLDEAVALSQMRQQLKKAAQRYEDKMNQQLSYQHNFLTAEIDRLKQIIADNEGRIAKQQFELDELLTRVETVQKKIENKTNLMAKQLAQFRRFYDQCYIYTNKRITDAQHSLSAITRHVEDATSTSDKLESWRYIEYANNLIKSIVAATSTQTSSLKHYLNEQIFQLEIQLSRFHQQYQKMDQIVYQMKEVKFGNESFRDCVKQLGKFGISTNNLRKDYHKQNFLQYYEPKFKQIIKRVNNSAIQIDLVKTLFKSESDTYAQNLAQLNGKNEQLTKVISTLQKSIEDQKIWHAQQIKQKEQILNKSNPRILELQTKLHSCFETQAKLIKQISQLKLKVSYYQTKCEKNSERQYNIQSTLAQAFSQTLVKQKTKKFQEEISLKEKKIKQLEQKIRDFDHQNYLLAEKLTKNEESTKENLKLQAQLEFASKMIEQYEVSRRNLVDESEQLKKQIQNANKQIREMETKNRLCQAKINLLISQKNIRNEDDQQYFDELEAEVENNLKQIEKLQKINKQLIIKNQQLISRNQQLQDDLHNYAETFEKQSITFRNALQNLQKEKDFLAIENKKMSEENKSLRMEVETSKSAQSFYENNSNISLQLRKTMSTSDFGEMKPMKKLQRKSLSSKEKIDKVLQLKGILQKLKYQLPVVCEIDGTGYLKDEKTGCYLMDENHNCFELNQSQLSNAIKQGLILL